MVTRLKIAYVLSIAAFLIIIYAKYEYITFLSIVFFTSLAFSYTGSIRGRLVWFGIVLYLAYMSLHYLISGNRNELACISAFILLSTIAIILLKTLDTQEMASHFSEKTPARMTAFLLAFNVCLLLGEIPLYFLLKYYNSFYEVVRIDSKYLMYIFLDIPVLGIINIVLIIKLLKGKASGKVFTAVLLVMSTLLWFNGLFFENMLLSTLYAFTTHDYPNIEYNLFRFLKYAGYINVIFLVIYSGEFNSQVQQVD